MSVLPHYRNWRRFSTPAEFCNICLPRGRRNSGSNQPGVPHAYSLRHRDTPKVFPVTVVNLRHSVSRQSGPASLNGKNDPPGFFHTIPCSLHARQRHRFHLDVKLAYGSHFEQLRNRREDDVERNRAKTAARDSQIDAAQRGAGQSDGPASALAHLHRRGGACGTRLEALLQSIQDQLCRPAPQVGDNHVNAGDSLHGQSLTHRVVGLTKRDHGIDIFTGKRVHAAARRDDALGSEQPRRLNGKMASHAGSAHDQDGLACSNLRALLERKPGRQEWGCRLLYGPAEDTASLPRGAKMFSGTYLTDTNLFAPMRRACAGSRVWASRCARR